MADEGDGLGFVPEGDGRRLLPALPAVRLLAVGDVSVPIVAGHGAWLDAFYAGVLGLEAVDPANPRLAVKHAETIARPRDAAPRLDEVTRAQRRAAAERGAAQGAWAYRAENFVLRYVVVPEIAAEQLKVVGVEVPSIEVAVKRMLERGIGYERVRGMVPGVAHVEVVDPAGHLVQVHEGRGGVM